MSADQRSAQAMSETLIPGMARVCFCLPACVRVALLLLLCLLLPPATTGVTLSRARGCPTHAAQKQQLLQPTAAKSISLTPDSSPARRQPPVPSSGRVVVSRRSQGKRCLQPSPQHPASGQHAAQHHHTHPYRYRSTQLRSPAVDNRPQVLAKHRIPSPCNLLTKKKGGAMRWLPPGAAC